MLCWRVDEDLPRLRGAITYENNGWARAGLTGPYDAGSSSSFQRAFQNAAQNADEIHFELTSFRVNRGAILSDFTEHELQTIYENTDLLRKTTFFRGDNSFYWNGKDWIDGTR